MDHRLFRPFLLLLVALATACDGTDPPVASTLEIVQGDAQTAVAGQPVAVAPSVRVLDQRGAPMAGVPVDFAIRDGGGSIAEPRVRTGADGTASPGSWTLGTRAGPNTLGASSAGLAPLTFAATGTAGAPARLEVVAGSAQSARVASPLPVAPAVRVLDANDNAVANTVVRFTVATGSGSIAGQITSSDAEGVARSGAWTLGTTAGTQTLNVAVDGGPSLEFRAVATPGAPTRIVEASAVAQSGDVGQPVTTRPAVIARDVYGNAVPGVAVRFAVESGAGSIHPSTAVSGAGAADATETTGADGTATLGKWTLGQRSGTQSVRASVEGIAPSVLFIANARPGSPASMTAASPLSQTGIAGREVAAPPAVRIADAFDNPIPGLTVDFTITDGGGFIEGPTNTTDQNGVARVIQWSLGPAAGANTLVARSTGLPDVVFTATGSIGGGGGGGSESFTIELRFYGTISPSQRTIFENAAGRWGNALPTGLPDVNVNIPANACGPAAISERVDDLLVLVEARAIDGPGGVLGSAGPCLLRSASGLPVIGSVTIDQADLAALEANGRLGDVMTHEIGHVLGIGTLWNSALLVGASGPDPYFTGAAARNAFLNVGGASYAGNHVPVENTGGAGTRGGHWRETVFGNELMTGWLNSGANPLSAVSIASLQDIGYVIDLSAAEGFALPGPDAAQHTTAPPFLIRELPWTRPPLFVDPPATNR